MTDDKLRAWVEERLDGWALLSPGAGCWNTDRARADLWLPGSGLGVAEGEADTLPHALCLAVLAWFEKEGA